MRDTKLYKLLCLLTIEELKQIQKMVKSPYFTTNLNVQKLFKILRPHHPKFDSKTLEKQNIYKKIFTNHKYSDIKLRKLFSELSSLIEEFIFLSVLEKENFEKKKLLLKGFLNRKSNDLFEKEERKLRGDIEKEPYRDEIYFKDKFDLELLLNEKIASKDLKARIEILEKSLKNLEYYYLISKSKLKNDLISLSGYVNVDLSILNEKINTKNIVLDIFSKLELMYASGDVKMIFEVKDLLKNNLAKIRNPLQLEILQTLLNFSIKQMQVDDVTFNDVVLELYKFGLEKQILIQNNQITNNTFLNILISSSKARDFDWANNFVKKFNAYLDIDSREDLMQLGMAYMYSYKGDYNQTINQLSQYKFNLSMYDYSSKILLSINYYEYYLTDKNYFEVLESYLDSFARWIQRNKDIDQSRKKAALNFISIIKKLSKEKLFGKLNVEKRKYFLDIISEHNITISRSWIIEKIMN